MSERDPVDLDAEREADAAAAEAGAIGGRAPEDEDPAARPVSEAGGGVSEGFELAEEDLVEQAQHGDGGPDPTRAAFTPEVESDTRRPSAARPTPSGRRTGRTTPKRGAQPDR